MRKTLALVTLLLAVSACRTIGLSHTTGGVSEVAPTVAAEMMLDSEQVVVLDVRTARDYRGPEGHIAGSLNAPFETIERQLAEPLPYQNHTGLVYGETSTEGEVAAKLLTVAGFRNVVHIAGGLKAWIERGSRTVNAQ